MRVFLVDQAGAESEVDLSPFRDFDAALPYLEGYFGNMPPGAVRILTEGRDMVVTAADWRNLLRFGKGKPPI